MHLGNTNQCYTYYMDEQLYVPEHKDLGIIIDSNLKFTVKQQLLLTRLTVS